ncbi:MAG: hypothetical protein IJH83_06805, partial [Coriobacteriales bacterium]|nr:hypothetical protein [Coriobacteriales bacterium]
MSRNTLENERALARKRIVVPAVAVCGVLLVWEFACRLGIVPAFLLPAPSSVAMALLKDAALIATHSATTLIESAIGLVIGVAIGFVLAILMDRFEMLYLALQPLITLSQTVPTIAIAP